MLEKISLIAQDRELYEAWSQAFEPFDNIEPVLGDLFEVEADAIVSPANSFGIMDGGIDLLIRDHLGNTEEKHSRWDWGLVHKSIWENHTNPSILADFPSLTG